MRPLTLWENSGPGAWGGGRRDLRSSHDQGVRRRLARGIWSCLLPSAGQPPDACALPERRRRQAPAPERFSDCEFVASLAALDERGLGGGVSESPVPRLAFQQGAALPGWRLGRGDLLARPAEPLRDLSLLRPAHASAWGAGRPGGFPAGGDPSADSRSDGPEGGRKVTPEICNIEAEQALLGAILLNNAVIDRVSGLVKGVDFHEPVHARIYATCACLAARDELASPITIKLHFEGDPGLEALGGPAYLARLAGAAISLFAAPDYARLVAETATRRRLAEALDQARQDIADPEKDAAAVMGGLEAHALAEEATESKNIIRFGSAVGEALTDAANARNGTGPQAMPSGISDLDKMLGGFHPGEFIILGGRPGMGKSSVALAFALNAARAGHGIAFASLEMTASSLALRAVSEETDRIGCGVAYADARRGMMNDAQSATFGHAGAAIADLPISIIPPHVRDLGGLFAAARRCAKLFEAKGTPMGALIVDYLQLIKTSKANRYEEITEISIMLKQIALQLKVPVIALSQLSRNVESREDKRPIMSDLRESGQLEQDADVILFCYRPEYYLRREEPDHDATSEEIFEHHDALRRTAGWMDIIVAKNRMGEIGNVRVRFDEKTNSVRGQA
jgi:replicative DNA helicase